MKLSAAIRKGNLPQINCRIIVLENNKLSGCALGSALAGVLGRRKIRQMAKVHADFYETFEKLFKVNEDVIEKITDMNDVDELSVEEIAKRLEAEGL